MVAVVLTIHTLIVLALIGVVLLQRSDGGALGLGGGGGGGGFMSGRGAANALTRTTSVLGAAFIATSLGLAIFAGGGENEETIIEELTGDTAPTPQELNAAPTTEDLLNSLGGGAGGEATEDELPGEPTSGESGTGEEPAAASPDSEAQPTPDGSGEDFGEESEDPTE